MYDVTGTYVDNGEERVFEKTVEAGSEDRAEELVYSQIGGDHSVRRNQINIERVEEV